MSEPRTSRFGQALRTPVGIASALGLIAIIVNGLLLWLVSWIAGGLDLPFHVQNFWPSAVLGALVVGVVSWVLNIIVPDGDK